MKSDTNHNYFAGGFAEIVSQPSMITYQFFSRWFTGAESIGRAMKLLGLPYSLYQQPLLHLENGELLVDLDAEEKTLYQGTFLRYGKQESVRETPKLSVEWSRLLNPLSWFTTASITLQQGAWIANPAAVLQKAKRWTDEIPTHTAGLSAEECDRVLAEQVWPKVIAVDVLCEFFNQYLTQECKEKYLEVLSYTSQEIAKRDWFFQSLEKQYAVKNGEMSLELYLEEFGLRADKDFELTSPRWSEVPELVVERIQKLPPRIEKAEPCDKPNFVSSQLSMLVDSFIELQVLRSEVKRKTLEYFRQLRRGVLGEIGYVDTPRVTHPLRPRAQGFSVATEGKGRGVSAGSVSGRVQLIYNTSVEIAPGTVGVFPNASPEFAFLYPRCAGMIFLSGGQTSHGAVVAREFGIPALVDPVAVGIQQGSELTINGTTGEWKVVGVKSAMHHSSVQIRILDDVSKHDASLVGAKAANLGELLKLGIPVPKGFVISIEEVLEAEHGQVAFDEDSTSKIIKAFDALEATEVAVRSSAVGEDGETASFAGQFTTYLGVKRESVIGAVVKCFESVDNRGAELYAAQRHLKPNSLQMSVLIQTMVPADISGIMFTKNLLTGSTNETTIEVVKGLGESLAQGEVIPEQFLINKTTENVISRSATTEPIINEAQLHELLTLATKIETHFGKSQDIEWAIVNDKIYILQARPVTV